MNYLREDLREVMPYRASNDKYEIMLNSNESPFDLPRQTKDRLIEHINRENMFNRYPDPDSTLLREAIGQHLGLSSDNILVASGSDELIQMIINAFVDRGEYVLCPSPSFTMYQIYTQIGGGVPIEVELDRDFNYDIDALLHEGRRYGAKIAFICNPNNPTGTKVDIVDIEYFIENFPGIVVIDEAYVEFGGDSSIDYILKYENAIVLRTFSKAFGVAGLRVGYLIANKGIVDDVYLTKSPYNINTFSQLTALEMLKDWNIVKERIDYITSERDKLYLSLSQVDCIDVLPSNGNFLLIGVEGAQSVYEHLREDGILVRNFSMGSRLMNYIRVTIGNREENDIFLQKFLSIIEEGDYIQ